MQRIAALSALCLAAGVTCSPAHADVLEIGENGASWISGGSQDSSQDVVSPSETELAKPEAWSIESSANAVTVPTLAAGPFAWSRRIAQLAAKYDLSPALLEAVVWQESRWRPLRRNRFLA